MNSRRTVVAFVAFGVAVCAFYAHLHENSTRPGHVSFSIFAQKSMTEIRVDGQDVSQKRYFMKDAETTDGDPVYGLVHARPGTVHLSWRDGDELFEAELRFAPQRPYSFGASVFLNEKSWRDSTEPTGIGRYITAFSRSFPVEVISVKKDGVEVDNTR